MGPARSRRARDLRAALPRGLPVRPLVADDPAQAAGVPGGVRRLRPRPRGARSASATSSGCSATPASSGIAGRSRRRSRTPARRWRSARPGEPLHELVWAHAPGASTPRLEARPTGSASTPESVALAKQLRAAGFRFVGPTTVYAAMQACGVVNDHLADCWVRDDVETRAEPLMLDDRVRAVLRRLEEETEAEEGRDLPVAQRSLQMPPTSGALLFALCRGPPGLRGARDRRLARLLDDLARRRGPRVRRARHLARGGPGEARGLGPEHRRRRARGVDRGHPGRRVREPRAARRPVRRRVPRRLEGRLRGALPARPRAAARPAPWSSPTTSLSHGELAAYSAARQADPALVSVTVPIDNGLEVTSRLDRRATIGVNRGKEVVR